MSITPKTEAGKQRLNKSCKGRMEQCAMKGGAVLDTVSTGNANDYLAIPW